MSERDVEALRLITERLDDMHVDGWIVVPDHETGEPMQERVPTHYIAQGVRDAVEAAGYVSPETLAERVREAVEAERERIAVAIQATKPPHMTRDYTPVDQAYDNAARIARTGSES